MTIEPTLGTISPPLADAGMLPQAVQAALQTVEDTMYSVVASDVAVLRDASRHILGAGGKRIRPRIVLLSFAAVGGTDYRDVVSVAAAVELVHTASVVHDDINDHGVVRRGRPSVNSIWGRTFALLTGDYMFAKVYELMAPHRNLNTIFSDATTALVEGETLQASAVKENNFSRQVYYDIIARKTAALFSAAARLGAIMGGGDEAQSEALAQFGFNIGMAFQIVDDVLDIVGSEDELGKTAGIDIQQGRGFAVAYTNNGDAPDPVASIKAKVMQGDAIQKAHEHAHHFVEAAIEGLGAIPDSESKTALIQLGRSVADRSF